MSAYHTVLYTHIHITTHTCTLSPCQGTRDKKSVDYNVPADKTPRNTPNVNPKRHPPNTHIRTYQVVDHSPPPPAESQIPILQKPSALLEHRRCKQRAKSGILHRDNPLTCSALSFKFEGVLLDHRTFSSRRLVVDSWSPDGHNLLSVLLTIRK